MRSLNPCSFVRKKKQNYGDFPKRPLKGKKSVEIKVPTEKRDVKKKTQKKRVKKRKYRTRLIHVTHLVIIVSSYLYILLSKRREKSKAGRCVLREQEKTITNQHTKKKSHSFTHTYTYMCKKKKENHTHRQRQFIPYFSETETSGDIISEREREKEKGSVEQAKRKTKKK